MERITISMVREDMGNGRYTWRPEAEKDAQFLPPGYALYGRRKPDGVYAVSKSREHASVGEYESLATEWRQIENELKRLKDDVGSRVDRLLEKKAPVIEVELTEK